MAFDGIGGGGINFNNNLIPLDCFLTNSILVQIKKKKSTLVIFLFNFNTEIF